MFSAASLSVSGSSDQSILSFRALADEGFVRSLDSASLNGGQNHFGAKLVVPSALQLHRVLQRSEIDEQKAIDALARLFCLQVRGIKSGPALKEHLRSFASKKKPTHAGGISRRSVWNRAEVCID